MAKVAFAARMQFVVAWRMSPLLGSGESRLCLYFTNAASIIAISNVCGELRLHLLSWRKRLHFAKAGLREEKVGSTN
jgi:hypothetical protein